ncbi:MAG: hypothetical protein WCK41_11865 [Actinomycetes bacterium]
MADSLEEFIMYPVAGGGIESWVAALSRKLFEINQLPSANIVIISGIEPGGPYVQCIIPHSPGVWNEAVSNKFLADTPWELSVDQESQLVDLGWNPPSDDPVDPHELHQTVSNVNWWQAWSAPIDTLQLASLYAATLIAIYGLSENEAWKIKITDAHCSGCWK